VITYHETHFSQELANIEGPRLIQKVLL